MGKYIDANSREFVHLVSNLEPRWKPMPELTREEGQEVYKELNSIAEAFLALPAADVEEVRRGHWVEKVVNGVGWWRECSECGGRWMLNGKTYSCVATPYCPHCGAKMDSEEVER